MKGLKIFLVSIYVVLICLLLLQKCNNSEGIDIGGTGKLKVTLLWDFPGDIDLHIIEPSGNEIYYANKRNWLSGGYLDVDNQQGGEGAAENIYWKEPPSGQYKVFLNFYNKSAAGGSGICRVIIRQEGLDTQTFEIPMSVVGETKDVTTITVN